MEAHFSPIMNASEPTSTIKILLLIAGTNTPSNAAVLGESMMKGATSKVTEVRKMLIRHLRIEHFDLSYYTQDPPKDDLEMVKQAILESDGVVIATPIWNFSVPAHLKNLIDRIGAFGLDANSHSIGQFGGKPFFLIFTGGTPLSAWPLMRRTTSHLSASLTYFGASVLGTHFEPRCTLGRGVFGLVVDQRPDSLRRMEQRGATFAESVRKFRKTGILPWKYRILRSVVKTAQRIKRRLGI
jgi:NAD(P)H-dependent FMN reductase